MPRMSQQAQLNTEITSSSRIPSFARAGIRQVKNISWFKPQFDYFDATPPASGTSGGKGSPSAHTAPSSKYSFFQIGTVFFSVSINQRHASKAAERWADATTI